MKTRHTPERRAPSSRTIASASSLPDADALAALRGWYAGLSSRDTVERYLPHALLVPGTSARGILGRIRRQLAAFAHERHRPGLVALFNHPTGERTERAAAVLQAITFYPVSPMRNRRLPTTLVSGCVRAPCACCVPTASSR